MGPRYLDAQSDGKVTVERQKLFLKVIFITNGDRQVRPKPKAHRSVPSACGHSPLPLGSLVPGALTAEVGLVTTGGDLSADPSPMWTLCGHWARELTDRHGGLRHSLY